MKTVTIKLITLIIITNFIMSFSLLVRYSSGADLEIRPLYGRAPIIDGEIDASMNEWDKAIKNTLNLYPDISNKSTSLPVELWVILNGSNLYISVQFNLEYQYDNNFLGLLIASNDSELDQDFKDAKIVQFSNISNNEYDYKDYFITDSTFYNDLSLNGNGAGKIEGYDYVYEFVLPIENKENETEDVYLIYGDVYAFKIIMGNSTKSPSYPDDIKVSNIVLIEITYLFPENEPISSELLYLILSIIIFGIIGSIYIFYIYRIIKLKEKIERIRS